MRGLARFLKDARTMHAWSHATEWDLHLYLGSPNLSRRLLTRGMSQHPNARELLQSAV